MMMIVDLVVVMFVKNSVRFAELLRKPVRTTRRRRSVSDTATCFRLYPFGSSFYPAHVRALLFLLPRASPRRFVMSYLRAGNTNTLGNSILHTGAETVPR